MNWETVTSGIGQKVYALRNNGRKLLTLAFNSSSSFAKVEYEGEKRAFILRYEGIFRNKMVMRNEYGVRLAQVSAEMKDSFINVHDEKLFYTITTGKESKVIIYKESPDNPLAVCDLKIENDKSLLPSVKSLATQHSLLLALSWYLFSPVANKTIPEFA